MTLKPGVGKTTSAGWLAHSLHAPGLSPLLVVSDPASSAPRRSEPAGSFPSPVLARPVDAVHRRVNDVLEHRRARPLDAPQREDHAHIDRGVIRQASEWIVPVAPAPIEPERMAPTDRETGDMQSLRSGPARVAGPLNHANRPCATRTGHDSDAREALTERGLERVPCTPDAS